jgi:acetate kinase
VDAARNAVHAPIISSDASRVVVRVIPTDEDLIIARHTRRLIEEGAAHGDHV